MTAENDSSNVEPVTSDNKNIADLATDSTNPVTNNIEHTKTNTLDFTFNRPFISEDGSTTTKEESVNASLLSLAPVPTFTIDEVVVDFDMEVKNSEVSTENKNATVESTVGYKSFRGLSTNIKGSVTSDSEHKRETDTSATYKIHARAVQQPPAAGMNKLTDLLAQTMEPIVIPDKSGK